MTAYTWKGGSGANKFTWELSTNWTQNNGFFPGHSASDTATINSSGPELEKEAQPLTIAGMTVGANGFVGVDVVDDVTNDTGDSGSVFTVTGAVSNSGDIYVGNEFDTGTTTATFGSVVTATAASKVFVTLAAVTVNGSVTNNGTEASDGGFLLGGGSLTVIGSFTNNGQLEADDTTLTIDGTLTNNAGGGTFSKGGVDITATSASDKATFGSIVNGAAGTFDIADPSATVTGNVTNSATGAFSFGVAYADDDKAGNLTVGGAFTNKGNFGIGNSEITSAVNVSLNVLSNSAAGNIIITGASLADTANLNVANIGVVQNAGSLNIGDDATATFAAGLNNTGKLYGTGTFDGNVTNSGTIAGGDLTSSTSGTLTIDGDYTQASTAKVTDFAADVGSGIDVTGSATLKGGALTLNTTGVTLALGNSFTVLSAADGLTGTFSSIDGVAGNVDTNVGHGLALVVAYNYTAGTVAIDVVEQGLTDTWTGPVNTSTNWDSADWTTRTPESTGESADSALINAGGAVFLDDTSDIGTIANVTLGAKSGTKNAADLEFIDGGSLVVENNITNNGKLGIDAGAGDSGSSLTVYGTLTNNADSTTGGGLQIGNDTGDASLTTVTLANLVDGAHGGVGIDNARVLVTGNVTNSGNNPGTDGIGVGYGSTSPGGLLEVDGTFTNSGAFAVGNTGVSLADAQIATLVNASTGVIAVKGNTASSTDISNLQAQGGSNAGKINVSDGGSLELGPTFSNTGTINLSGSSELAELAVNGGGLTLSGGGKIVMSNNSAAIVTASDATNGFTVADGTSAQDGDEIHVTIANTTLGVTQTVTATIDGTIVTASNSSIAAAIAAAIDGNSTLTNAGITASSVGGLFVIREPGAVGDSTTVNVDDTTNVSGTETVEPDGSSTLSGGGNPTFTNVNNTISGQGTIGDQYMTLNNEGTIDSNTDRELTIDTGNNAISNSGLLESTSEGGLEIDSNVTNTKTIEASGTFAFVDIEGVTITNTGGVILASGTDAFVGLDGGTIVGGKLESSGSASIGTDFDSTGNELNGVTITAGSTVGVGSVNQDATLVQLALAGTIANSGTIQVNAPSGAWTSELEISGNVSLTGGGKVTLANATGSKIVSVSTSATTLTNVNNTISGSGTIGDTHMTLDNESVIDANSAADPLILNTGTTAIQNSGTLEATGTGLLEIKSAVTNTSTGVILASVGQVDLYGSVTNGTLKTASNGSISVFADIALNGTTNTGSLTVRNGEKLELQGSSFTNSGQILVDGPSLTTTLQIDNNISLTGAGTITLGGGGAAGGVISDNSDSLTLTNVNNKIVGEGTLGDENMVLINDASGVIDGNSTDHTLTLIAETTNLGVIEGTTTKGLTVNTLVTNEKTLEALGTNANVTIDAVEITNTNGLILASGTGANVALDGATILNGKLQTTGTGAVIENVSGESDDATLDGVTIVAGSLVEAVDSTNLKLKDTITNAGTLEVASTGDLTSIEVSGNVILTGAGKLVLGGSQPGGDILDSDGSTATLENVNNTISGAGRIGGDTFLSLTNDASGVINGNSAVTDLIIAAPTTNFGLIEGTSVQGLAISDDVTNHKTIQASGTNAGVAIDDATITNTGGLVLASGTGATVVLENGATISGGTVQTSGTNAAFEVSGSSNSISNATIAAKTAIQIVDNASLTLSGDTDSGGAIIKLNSSTHTTSLLIAGTITLAGSGSITLSGTEGVIVDNGSGATLTNTNNTISGAGTIGGDGNNLTLNNGGIVDANSAGHTLQIETGSQVVTNTGTLEATAGGELEISSSSVTNSKTIEASGSGSTVTIDSNATVSNTGLILASGNGATVDLNGATISGGTVQTSGTGAFIESSGIGLNKLTNVAIAANTEISVANGSTLLVSGGSAGAGATIELGTGSTVALNSATGINVSFQTNGAATLELGQITSAATAHAYTGTISGFGAANGVAHSNSFEIIVLNNMAYDGQTAVFTQNASKTGGVLDIMDGVNTSQVDAVLNLAGSYTAGTPSNFVVKDNGSGKVEITDPSSTTPLADIGLLNNYVAASTGSNQGIAPLTTHTASTQTQDLTSSHHA